MGYFSDLAKTRNKEISITSIKSPIIFPEKILGKIGIYLASPYYHDDTWVKDLRNKNILRALNVLLNEPYSFAAFSPIIQLHSLIKMFNLQTDKKWNNVNEYFISKMDEFWIFTQEGWEKDDELNQEIMYAQKIKKPLTYFYLNELNNLIITKRV